MFKLAFAKCVQAMQATRKPSSASIADPKVFPSVSIDSRTIQKGECFFAIKGKTQDGFRYVGQALERDAGMIVTGAPFQDSDRWPDRVFLQVDDPIKALHRLARFVRRQWGRRVLAITGSMGKTTSRDFSAHLLASSFRVHQSEANFNNEIGVPLSLLRLESEDELSVLELGMNHKGEISLLGRICEPNVALITNVAPVHLEFFNDLDEIAAAKGEVLETLGPAGRFIYNRDDYRVARLARQFAGDTFSFGFHEEADVRLISFQSTGLDRTETVIEITGEPITATLPFTGKHFLYNVLAATALASSEGIAQRALCEAISSLAVPERRGQLLEIERVTIWDDSYNSNPRAVESLLEMVARLDRFRRRIVALGDMLELGIHSKKFHREIGERAASSRIDLLITVGTEASEISGSAIEAGFPVSRTKHFTEPCSAGEFLKSQLRPGDFLAVKGSRGVKMEKILKRLREGEP